MRKRDWIQYGTRTCACTGAGPRYVYVWRPRRADRTSRALVLEHTSVDAREALQLRGKLSSDVSSGGR